jgi:hypothetical protein
MTIKTYTGQNANFYIQSKGLHAGRPLKNPIPNCFAVNTEVANAFEIVYSLWIAKAFQYYIGGTCVPFIRIGDLKNIVIPAIENAKNVDEKQLKAIELIEKNIEIMNKKIKLMQELKNATAKSINQKLLICRKK